MSAKLDISNNQQLSIQVSTKATNSTRKKGNNSTINVALLGGGDRDIYLCMCMYVSRLECKWEFCI